MSRTRREIIWRNIREQAQAYEAQDNLSDELLERILKHFGGPLWLEAFDALGMPRPDEDDV